MHTTNVKSHLSSDDSHIYSSSSDFSPEFQPQTENCLCNTTIRYPIDISDLTLTYHLSPNKNLFFPQSAPSQSMVLSLTLLLRPKALESLLVLSLIPHIQTQILLALVSKYTPNLLLFNSSKVRFLSFSAVDILDQELLVARAVRCIIVRCLATPLASTH